MEMAESSLKGWKTLSEKEKLLVMSNFSFFLQCFQKTCIAWEKKACLGKG